jgi:hypothetical protein
MLRIYSTGRVEYSSELEEKDIDLSFIQMQNNDIT